MTSERAQQFARHGAPYFQSVIVGAAHHTFSVKFETRDDMVVVALELESTRQRSRTPIARHVVVDEVRSLELVECMQEIVWGLHFRTRHCLNRSRSLGEGG